MVNISRYGVTRIIQRLTTTGLTTANRIGHCGRRRALRTSVSEPHLTARELQKSVEGEAANVSVDTVKRKLRRSGLISYLPKVAMSLGRVQKQTLLMWARQYSIWSEQAWRSVVFSDEAAIEIGAIRSQYIRYGRGASILCSHTQSRRHFTINVMFWGCITANGPYL